MKQATLKKVGSVLLITLLAVIPLLPRGAALAANPTDDLIIGKVLRTNVGTTAPNATFNFQLQYVELENDSTPAVVVPGFPVGTWVTRGNVAFTTTTALTPTVANPDIVTATGQSADLLAGIDWQRVGRYTFLLREEPGTFTPNNTPPMTEMMEFDPTVFGVQVWVNTAANGDLYVEAVHVFETDEDGGFGSKVAEEDRFFTNTFIRAFENPTSGTGPAQRGLNVNKTVTGSAGNQTTDFQFSGTITSAAVTPTGHTGNYTATIVGPTAAPNHGDTITFASGVASTFTLRHGQSLQFNHLPVGTRFNIEETDFFHYTPALALTVNGASVTPHSATITGTQQIGELQNDAAFTNAFSPAPITGLLTNNFPFILVAGASIGIIALVVISRKRSAYE